MVLHIGFALALLNAIVLEPLRRPPSQTSAIVYLPILPETAKAAPQAQAGGNGQGVLRAPVPVFQTYTPPSGVISLGQALFVCRPENWRDLSEEQRADCTKRAGTVYAGMKDGLPIYIKPKGPEWEGLRNSDLRARERNTADPCMAAKQTGTECIHTVIHGKGLW